MEKFIIALILLIYDLNNLRSRAIHRLMIHFFLAKLFFMIFCISCKIDLLAANPTAHSTPSISCINIKNKRYLQLNSNEDTHLAIFLFRDNWYVVWSSQEPSTNLTIPPQEEWPAGFIALKNSSDVKTSKPCFIMSFKVPAEMMPMVTKTEKGWAIHVVSEYLLKDNPNPDQISLDHSNTGQFRILNVRNPSFIRLNMPTKEELSIILTDHPDTGLDFAQYDYADVYESIQGACLYLKSDQLFVEKQGQDATYYLTKNPILYSQAQIEEVDTTPTTTFIRQGVFTSMFRNSLAEKALYDKKNRPLYLLRQAWIEIALGEGNEAIQTILLLEKEHPKFSKSFTYQAILGIAQCLSQRYTQSLQTLASLPNTPEINLWRTLSKSQIDEQAIFETNAIDILKEYPSNLRDYILSKIIPHLFESRQIKLLKAIFKDIPSQTKNTQTVITFYKAMYTFTFEDQEQGYKLLLPIAKNETSQPMPFEFITEARLETFFHEHGNDPIDTIIAELDILRTQARGHDVEVKICLKLIEQLEKKKNYPAIIELLQDLSARFKKFDISIGFHQLLSYYLEKFFITDSSDTPPTKVISLFVKYNDLISHYYIYESIAAHVASLYEKVDLLDKAVLLLTDVAAKTTNINKKAQYQLKIGKLYVQNEKPEAAINLLTKIYPQLEEQYQKSATTILAKAYCQKKDYHKAIHWLQHHPNKKNLRQIADIYIEQENYPHIVNSLRDYLSILTNDDDDNRELALIQLAAAYHIQKKSAQLKELYETHKEFMQGRKNEDIFAMFCRPHAEHLQTPQDAYNYIHDGNTLREILESSRVHS